MDVESQVLNFFRKHNHLLNVGALTSILWDSNEPFFPNYNYFRTLVEEALTHLKDQGLLNKSHVFYSLNKSNDVSIVEED